MGNLSKSRALLFLGCFAHISRFVDGYTCDVVTRRDTTNFGPGITDEAHEGLSPFAIGEYNAVIAFDESHCIQMCCEQEECYVAVFDHTEAVCYFKGAGALHTYDFVAEEGFSSFELLFREGSAGSMQLEPTDCKSKRGVAYDFTSAADLEVLSEGLSWWYNWAPGILDQGVAVAQATSGCEYIPMIWGEKDLTNQRLANLDVLEGQVSSLLGFNEPNFQAQANLSPQEAASLWSMVKDQATALGMDLVSPAVNYCGSNCVEPNPYTWLDEFFEACAAIPGGCGVKAIGVHIYACEAVYLNKILHGYLKYGRPIWLTEFACADDAALETVAGQRSYLSEALLLLELHPDVERYAWFTGRDGDIMGVSGADLLAGEGELSSVGEIFFNTYKNLQRCDGITGTVIDGINATVTSTSSSSDTTSSPWISVPGEGSGGTDVDPSAIEITNVIISNIGGSGTYNDVVDMISGEDMVCSAGASACMKEEVEVSGPLAPFDEPQTIAFRGPLNLHNLAWYEGTANALSQTSRWNPNLSDNVVFMKNLGGSTGCTGVWTICGGSAQTFSDASGESCSDKPEQFAGRLGSDQEVNIMTSVECTGSGCGYYRDTGMEGWSGGSDGTKVFVFEVDMPHCGEDDFEECTYNRPAVWALNAKVVRTSQYGCNCRGAGGNGGCGEFDIVEAVIGIDYSDMLFTTVYDDKGTGAPGHNKYFLRPSASTHFAAIYRGGTSAYLEVVQLVDWDYTETSITGAFLDELKGASTEVHDVYIVPA